VAARDESGAVLVADAQIAAEPVELSINLKKCWVYYFPYFRLDIEYGISTTSNKMPPSAPPRQEKGAATFHDIRVQDPGDSITDGG